MTLTGQPFTIASRVDRDYQRYHGADGAAYRNDTCRGVVFSCRPRQDHDYALPQAHRALGQAEGLTALFWRGGLHKGGVGG